MITLCKGPNHEKERERERDRDRDRDRETERWNSFDPT